ncbi:MAG: hypothetical protein ACRDPS_21970 [Nocardioides sp.]|uniref:hypothetical protein n=1 Tax=Nocardioides sp. TaxID=35761 RepID=UPI003D6B047B
MALIIGYGSGDKGGVGKSTEALITARILAEDFNVLLVNADSVRTVVRVINRGQDEHFPFDLADAVGELDRLADLRRDSPYDFIVVDLPGVAVGAFQSMLTGADGKPIADLLVMPSKAEFIELEATVDAIDNEVAPTGLPYLLVLNQVPTQRFPLAEERREELRGRTHRPPVKVADTIIRHSMTYFDAHEGAMTVIDMPGARSYARILEAEQRALVNEIRSMLNTPASRRR